MKKFAFIVTSLLAVTFVAFAQNQGMKEWQDRIQSEKVAFLTNEMQLTPEEAQAFWPLYNKAQAEQRQAFEKMTKAYAELGKALAEGKGDAEISSLLHTYADAAAEQDHVSSKYVREYEKVLSSVKVAKLYMGEEKFRLTQIRNLGMPGGMRPGNPQGWQQGQPQGQQQSQQSWKSRSHGQNNK